MPAHLQEVGRFAFFLKDIFLHPPKTADADQATLFGGTTHSRQ
jgi:hypothetical protein